MVTWEKAKQFTSPADIERLACIGWTVLDAGGVNEDHWQTIGPQVKGVKLASFKRQIWVISKKCKKAGGDDADEDANGMADEAGKGKVANNSGKGGRKRKATAAVAQDNDEAEGEKSGVEGPKKKGGKRAKKASAPSEVADVDGEGDATHGTFIKAEDDVDFLT